MTRKSIYNSINIAVAINLITDLLKHHVIKTGADIIILTLYHAQLILLLTIIALLRRD